jgi:hypothetical protein
VAGTARPAAPTAAWTSSCRQYAANRREFAKLIWRFNSPKWAFDDAIFDRTAASFENPDHVSIVIHNYRWRLSLAEGDPQYDHLDRP